MLDSVWGHVLQSMYYLSSSEIGIHRGSLPYARFWRVFKYNSLLVVMQSKTRASGSSVTCLFTGAHVSFCLCIGLTPVKRWPKWLFMFLANERCRSCNDLSVFCCTFMIFKTGTWISFVFLYKLFMNVMVLAFYTYLNDISLYTFP